MTTVLVGTTSGEYDQPNAREIRLDSNPSNRPMWLKMTGNTTCSLTDRAHFMALIALVCVTLFTSVANINATDCPTGADEISIDRPDFTSPPAAVPTGSVQLEHSHLERGARSDIVEGSQTLVQLGVAHRAEILNHMLDTSNEGVDEQFVAGSARELGR